jgi:hypothetical protein
VIIALISLGVSIRSCYIAERSLDATQKQFYQINRPLLLLTPVKFEDNQKYLKISKENNYVETLIRYKVENIGNVVAKNIEHPQSKKLIDIAPGEVQYFLIVYESRPTGKSSLEEVASAVDKGMQVKWTINYTSELDKSIKYRVSVENIIFKDSAIVLESSSLSESTIEH